MNITNDKKIKLIDEYLNTSDIDPRWELMILEYRRFVQRKIETNIE